MWPPCCAARRTGRPRTRRRRTAGPSSCPGAAADGVRKAWQAFELPLKHNEHHDHHGPSCPGRQTIAGVCCQSWFSSLIWQTHAKLRSKCGGEEEDAVLLLRTSFPGWERGLHLGASRKRSAALRACPKRPAARGQALSAAPAGREATSTWIISFQAWPIHYSNRALSR